MVLFIASCGNKVVPQSTSQETTGEVKLDDSEYVKNGFKSAVVIDNSGLDGCGFMILLEDKAKLQPVSLPEEFKKHQLPVWIKFQYKKGAVGVCMSGRIVNLLDIKPK